MRHANTVPLEKETVRGWPLLSQFRSGTSRRDLSKSSPRSQSMPAIVRGFHDSAVGMVLNKTIPAVFERLPARVVVITRELGTIG